MFPLIKHALVAVDEFDRKVGVDSMECWRAEAEGRAAGGGAAAEAEEIE